MLEVNLDGTTKSTLDWSKQRKIAEGRNDILWNIDLGLFSRLPEPLSTQTQYQSLKLSLEHFCNTLWKEFRNETRGICLYKGPADFSIGFPWDEGQKKNLAEWVLHGFGDAETLLDEVGVSTELLLENEDGRHLMSLYCRDVAGEYLDLISGYLPEGLDAYISFDASAILDPVKRAQLITKERFPHLKIITDGQMESSVPIGICFPSVDVVRPSQYRVFKKVLGKLTSEKIEFRIIPEALLTSEWHGLDELYVSFETLSPQGKRKLLGFEATGGKVIRLA